MKLVRKNWKIKQNERRNARKKAIRENGLSRIGKTEEMTIKNNERQKKD